jgi:hypothetical protein
VAVTWRYSEYVAAGAGDGEGAGVCAPASSVGHRPTANNRDPIVRLVAKLTILPLPSSDAGMTLLGRIDYYQC